MAGPPSLHVLAVHSFVRGSNQREQAILLDMYRVRTYACLREYLRMRLGMCVFACAHPSPHMCVCMAVRRSSHGLMQMMSPTDDVAN